MESIYARLKEELKILPVDDIPPQRRVNFAMELFVMGVLDLWEFLNLAGITVNSEVKERLKFVTVGSAIAKAAGVSDVQGYPRDSGYKE